MATVRCHGRPALLGGNERSRCHRRCPGNRGRRSADFESGFGRIGAGDIRHRPARVNQMARTTTEIGELREYSDRLARYSSEELEDIYYNIHILRHPLRYRLLMREMERRRMR